jgi:hypothetical protein
MTEESEDDETIKETYARFGLAVYMANVLELALAQTLMQIEFLTPFRDEYIRTHGKNFDRKKFDTEFDSYMKKQFEKMMGTLALRISKCSGFSEELKARIAAAKNRRNVLVHHYWRESAVIVHDEGRSSEDDRRTFKRCRHL